MGVILLTGSTGFLGTQIARRIITETEHSMVALVRAESDEAAFHRLSRTWWDWPQLAKAIGGRVEVLRGELSEERLGLSETKYKEIAKKITHIIHTAADMRLDGPIDELRKANVQGTAKVIQLAKNIHIDHGLTRLSHVSTAYVAGARKGEVPEDSLTDEYGFSSPYELSKFEGETLIAKARAELPISVFRPGMVVGDSKTGQIKTFNTVYFPLRLYFKGQMRIFPVRPSLKVNMVPVDYVADAVVKLTIEPKAEGLNFHLTAPYKSLPTAKEFIRFAQKWARKNLGIKLPRPLFIPAPTGATKGRYRTQKAVQPSRKGFLSALIILAPYFNERRRYRRDNINRLMGPYKFRWQDVASPMLGFAAYLGYLHRADRTVHEQILFRLKGRSMPVSYYDVIDGRIEKRNTAQIRKDILTAAGALKSMGIGKGDMVAMVGHNSTRYLTLDVAIGLLGAVNIPLYYTSPPADIEKIVAASGSKVLLIGAPKILENVDDLKLDIPIISFCRKTPSKNITRNIISWDGFLAKGKGIEVPTTSPVGFGDLATCRYTSGTTGTPKGTCFSHQKLRWMGESLCSLLPWKTKNTGIYYMSFLPMNHVVEGILAMYAPYYAPGPLNIYYLEDFRDLQKTIIQVRPTLFFSVPRFFEKVWDGLMEKKAGQNYTKAPPGFKKNIMRRIIRKALLKKVGLDRCDQLIVGAAPMGEGLARDYSELGIEIHNAYGLTEAPLVTINRLGANKIGTVGRPLPNTKLHIGEDGEVLIRGPQVTQGYLDPGIESPVRDGWLYTGDLGKITKDGSLVIDGRKKELIVTSYGKNIHPTKIEAMLKEIPGVDEAMVVGDDKPYCGAFLWVGGEKHGSDFVGSIENSIVKINKELSHPEQLKRWAILKNDLSIEKGDLTASLKLKRWDVMKSKAQVVDALYGNEIPKLNGLIHMGRTEKIE